jgi:hypothetical protein
LSLPLYGFGFFWGKIDVAIILDSVKDRAMKDESGRPTDILLNLIVF